MKTEVKIDVDEQQLEQPLIEAPPLKDVPLEEGILPPTAELPTCQVHETMGPFSPTPLKSSLSCSYVSLARDVCRICHCEGDADAPLIAPCHCAGSLKFVHQACLQQWIQCADIKACELCQFPFHMTTKLKPFIEWQRLSMSRVEQRKVACSVAFHLVAITCVIWSLFVLIERSSAEIQAGVLEWPFWTKLIVVAIGFTGGLVFMYVQCKMYLHLCRRWRAYNRTIYIRNASSVDRGTSIMGSHLILPIGALKGGSIRSLQETDLV